MNTKDTGGRDPAVDIRQANEFEFPYHHIPTLQDRRKAPQLARKWGYAASYLAAVKLAQAWLQPIVAQGQADPHRHMDFGCGEGAFVQALQPLEGFEDVHFHGVDMDARAIRWAHVFSEGIENLRFEQIDLFELPEAHYDSGSLIEVLEHIPPNEIEGFVSALARALKPGAPLFVTVPSVEKKVLRKHYQHFNFDTVKACFAEDFEVDACFGFERRSAMTRTVERLLSNRYFYLETPATTRALIAAKGRRYDDLAQCGRICLHLRKRV